MSRSAVILASAALVLTGLGAAGWAVWNSTSAAHGGRAPGYGVTVEVVPPVEPDLPPGSIMTVGELRDGYEHDAERVAPPPRDDEPYGESAWLELTPEPSQPPYYDTPSDPGPPRSSRPAPELERDDYGFGFDAPQPDYAAERAARQSALQERPQRHNRPAAEEMFY
ncbi:hypothetical protein RSD66_08000 [Brevundimonas sp. S1H14]|uniref:hypothetical protein n=1 Tax=Brevundimonas sp. S1H14 TaxID=3078084 RepID=UPI0039EB77AB